MNRLQQRAWTNLIVIAIILVFVAIRFVVTADGFLCGDHNQNSLVDSGYSPVWLER